MYDLACVRCTKTEKAMIDHRIWSSTGFFEEYLDLGIEFS